LTNKEEKISFVKNINRTYVIDDMKLRYSKISPF